MKPSALLFLLVPASIVAAIPATLSSRQTPDAIVTYAGLASPVGYSYGDCIPATLDGHVATTGRVRTLAKCYFYTDANCVHELLPAPVIVPPDIPVPNIADFAELLAESVSCVELPLL